MIRKGILRAGFSVLVVRFIYLFSVEIALRNWTMQEVSHDMRDRGAAYWTLLPGLRVSCKLKFFLWKALFYGYDSGLMMWLNIFAFYYKGKCLFV